MKYTVTVNGNSAYGSDVYNNAVASFISILRLYPYAVVEMKENDLIFVSSHDKCPLCDYIRRVHKYTEQYGWECPSL